MPLSSLSSVAGDFAAGRTCGWIVSFTGAESWRTSTLAFFDDSGAVGPRIIASTLRVERGRFDIVCL
jgi:hypothetical protein